MAHFLQKRRGTRLFGGMKSRMLASPWKMTCSGLNAAAPTKGAPPERLQTVSRWVSQCRGVAWCA